MEHAHRRGGGNTRLHTKDTGRSESRKRNRNRLSESPEAIRSSKAIKDKQGAKKDSKSDSDKSQAKITSYQGQNQNESKMATSTASEIKAILEEMKKMNTKMDSINEKLDKRIELLESRVYDVEKQQDVTKNKIETMEKSINLNEELTVSVETSAKLALDQSVKNEQFLRNYNIRIFNIPEEDKETIQVCQTKVLNLFEEKLGVKVPLEAIDNLHRVGPKPRQSNQNTNPPQ